MNYVEIDQEKRYNTAKAYGRNENAISTSTFLCELLESDFFHFCFFKIVLAILDRQSPKERPLTLSVLKGHWTVITFF